MKKGIKLIATTLILSALSLGAMACDFGGNSTEQEQSEIEQVYGQYVVYAQAEGITPLSYEEWLATIKGDKG